MEPRRPRNQLSAAGFCPGTSRRLWLGIVIAWIAIAALPVTAATRAIIVVGLTADEEHAERLLRQAETAQRGFLARGIRHENISLLAPVKDAPVKRDAVLSALRGIAAADNDETWIILLGHSAIGRGGQPAFQVSGPRLTADDLATALGRLPGKKFVVIATANCGGFLPPLLALPQVEAVAATADKGEINEPRFAEAWTEILLAQPQADFATLVSETVRTVGQLYAKKSLALAEHAQLIDRATGKIIDTAASRAEPPATTPP